MQRALEEVGAGGVLGAGDVGDALTGGGIVDPYTLSPPLVSSFLRQKWPKPAHSIVRPSNQRPSPLDCPDRSLARMQRHLLVPEPALLMEDERARHSSRNELAHAALAKVGLERDAAHRSSQVEDVGFGSRQGLDGDFACKLNVSWTPIDFNDADVPSMEALATNSLPRSMLRSLIMAE